MRVERGRVGGRDQPGSVGVRLSARGWPCSLVVLCSGRELKQARPQRVMDMTAVSDPAE